MTNPAKPSRRRRRGGRVPTLLDVAREAGVSAASVSRALARPELVSEAVRANVARVAAALGYVPNPAARALSACRSGCVGLIAGSLEDVVVSQAIEGLSPRLQSEDLKLLFCTSTGRAEDTRQLARKLLEQGVEALSFVGVDVPDDIEDLATGRRLRPWVCVDQLAPGGSFAPFTRVQGLELAIRFLCELGHRRVALVAPGRACPVAQLRQALGDSDVALIEIGQRGDQSSQHILSEALKSCLAQPRPPTAFVCGSDAVAAATLHECHAQGIIVPGDVSIVGFGNTELARRTHPMLSTLRVPAREAGAAAAEFLLAGLRGQVFAAHELSAKLVVRESTASPRSVESLAPGKSFT